VEDTAAAPLGHTVDRYGGVIVDHLTLPGSAEEFTAALVASIATWMSTGVRGVWLRRGSALRSRHSLTCNLQLVSMDIQMGVYS